MHTYRYAEWRVRVPASALPGKVRLASRCAGARADTDYFYVRPSNGRVVVAGREVHADAEGYSRWAVRLRNPYAAFGLRRVRIEVALIDVAGNAVDAGTHEVEAIGPRATALVASGTETLSEVPVRVRVRVLQALRHPSRHATPRVSNVRLVPEFGDWYERMHVRADVANRARARVESPATLTVLRDGAGRIIGVDRETYGTTLRRGERTAHQATFDGSAYLGATSAEVFVSARFAGEELD